MEKVFLAFGGHEGNNTSIEKIQRQRKVTLLNLELFNQDELNQFLIEENIALPYEHINKEIQYDKSKYYYSWGVIYEFNNEIYDDNFIFLLELYLNSFLTPIFRFDRLGFRSYESKNIDTFSDAYLDKIDIIRLEKFMDNFIGIIDYSHWLRPTIYQWVKNKDKESFRLFTGLALYSNLRKYSNGKSPLFWKSEVMDIGIILETLFTEPTEKESIGYILRKRIHFLSLDLISDIENKIKEIYNTRSNFVHGSLFVELIKQYEIVGDDEGEDIKEIYSRDMFDKTLEYLSILRKVILLYFLLFKRINQGDTCINRIEKSMFDTETKEIIEENVELLKSIISY